MLKDKMEMLEARLCKEVDDLLGKPVWADADLNNAGKIIDIAKDSSIIEAMNNYGKDAYDYYSGISHGDIDTAHMRSMRRDRLPVTGQYVSRDMDYDRRYSGHSITDRAVAMLEGEMDTVQSPYERQKLEHIIDTIRTMK